MPIHYNGRSEIVGTPICDMEGCNSVALVMAMGKVWCGKCTMELSKARTDWIIHKATEKLKEENKNGND